MITDSWACFGELLRGWGHNRPYIGCRYSTRDNCSLKLHILVFIVNSFLLILRIRVALAQSICDGDPLISILGSFWKITTNHHIRKGIHDLFRFFANRIRAGVELLQHMTNSRWVWCKVTVITGLSNADAYPASNAAFHCRSVRFAPPSFLFHA